MADDLKFYGPQSGEPAKVPHEAGRAARLEAAGVPQPRPLEELWRERADKAWAAAGGQESHGFVQEPVTEKSVSGHSKEKKAALKLMEEEGITLAEALERAKSEDRPVKKSKAKGK